MICYILDILVGIWFGIFYADMDIDLGGRSFIGLIPLFVIPQV